jgi:antitoxin VapB
MGMNIKSENTHRRAKELARIAGETIAEAVDRAVTERLERLRRRRNRKALAERLLKIGDQCSRLPVLDSRAPDEMLYDENGLPR